MAQGEGEQVDRGRRRKELLAAYHDCFASPHGQLVLRDLAKLCHLGRGTYTAGAPDMVAFLEGQRSVMLHILHCCKVNANDPNTWRQVMGDEPLAVLNPPLHLEGEHG